jgi:hypothetical protein
MNLFITIDHLHSIPGQGVRPGWCHQGARAFCKRYNLDWTRIVADGGVDADALLATGDALAIKLVQHAAKLETNHGQ